MELAKDRQCYQDFANTMRGLVKMPLQGGLINQVELFLMASLVSSSRNNPPFERLDCLDNKYLDATLNGTPWPFDCVVANLTSSNDNLAMSQSRESSVWWELNLRGNARLGLNSAYRHVISQCK